MYTYTLYMSDIISVDGVCCVFLSSAPYFAFLVFYYCTNEFGEIQFCSVMHSLLYALNDKKAHFDFDLFYLLI